MRIGVDHQRAARPVHMTVVLIFGALAAACIAGGVYAVFKESVSDTEFSLLGAHLKTGHVGVAFIGIGLIIALFSVRSVLKNLSELAALPEERPSPIPGPNREIAVKGRSD